MDKAATKIQQEQKKKQARKKAKKVEKTQKIENYKAAKKQEKSSGYNREDEKNQEIGEEFLNPDKDMEQAASTIQGHFRKKQAKKKEKQQKLENQKTGNNVATVEPILCVKNLILQAGNTEMCCALRDNLYVE